MASGVTTPAIVLLLGISLSGCALPAMQSIANQTKPYDSAELESLADLEPGELLNYQQRRYRLEDPPGDHALLNLLHLTATDVAWHTLTGQGYREILDEINELRSGFEYRPIGLDRFSGIRGRIPETLDSAHRKPWSKNDDVFMRVIAEERQNGILPTPGVCHRWSSAYRKNPQSDTFPYIFFSKLLWALAYGESSVYFVTENEEQLAQWIVEREPRSVTLDELFRQSYRLNSGDVYLSLLTPANVFSRFWYLPHRENLSIATQLALITTQQDGAEDNYGAWHHFWGMALFGYCLGETNSRLAGWIESLGSGRVTEHGEVDEYYINRHAGAAGAKLRELIENRPGQRTANRAPAAKDTDASFAFRR